jgi:hypothetical protein
LEDLALVINDPLAPRVLAWWDKTKPDMDNPDLDAACRLLLAPMPEITVTIERCRLAGLLHADGIADVARKWLATYVARELGVKPAKKKRKR